MIAFTFVFWCGNFSVFSASVIVNIELVSNGIEITGADKIYWHTETEDMVENRREERSGYSKRKWSKIYEFMLCCAVLCCAVLYAIFSSLEEEKLNKHKKHPSTKALTFISILSFL